MILILVHETQTIHVCTVHVWAAISTQGATNICIFERKMDSIAYQDVLSHFLLPFVRDKYPAVHIFTQDNNPKHIVQADRKPKHVPYSFLERIPGSFQNAFPLL